METEKTPNSQSSLEGKKKRAEGFRLPDFRLYYKVTVITTIWYWHKNRNIDQWNRIEIPEINPHTYGQLIYDKGEKDIQWRKDSLFNKWCWENWTATCKRMKLEHSLTPYTKINSKCIRVLNISLDTIKLLQENIGRTLNIQHSKIFFDPPPRVMEIKTKINKLDLMKLQRFCTAKEALNKPKRQPSEWEKIFANKSTDKGLISKIYKQLMQLNIKKNKQPNPKMGRRLKLTCLQRRHTDDQEAHEKLLNINNYQRNANQNYNEVSPHTSQTGHHQKTYKQQMLLRVWRKWNPLTLLVGM